MVDLKKDDEILQAIELMYFGYRAFTRGPDTLLEKRGLSRSHHRILYFIAHRNDVSVGELLTILDISKQALNIPLRQLVSMDLVNQSKSPEDARVKILSLTASGRKLEKSLTRTQRGLIQDILSEAGPSGTTAWFHIMQELAESEM